MYRRVAQASLAQMKKIKSRTLYQSRQKHCCVTNQKGRAYSECVCMQYKCTNNAQEVHQVTYYTMVEMEGAEIEITEEAAKAERVEMRKTERGLDKESKKHYEKN